MNELYNLNPKTRWRLIMILSVFIGIIVISGLIENHNLNKIHRDFASMYADRLIPATEIYLISEYLYEKRLLLETFDSNPSAKATSVLKQIYEREQTIDSLIHAYEQTHLVHQESAFLDQLKEDLKLYSTSEEQVISLIRKDAFGEAKDLFERETRELFANVILDLQLLAKIQPTVGEELFQSSNSDFASNHLLFYLRFALTIFISVFILILIRTSGMLHQPQQKFRLN